MANGLKQLSSHWNTLRHGHYTLLLSGAAPPVSALHPPSPAKASHSKNSTTRPVRDEIPPGSRNEPRPGALSGPGCVPRSQARLPPSWSAHGVKAPARGLAHTSAVPTRGAGRPAARTLGGLSPSAHPLTSKVGSRVQTQSPLSFYFLIAPLQTIHFNYSFEIKCFTIPIHFQGPTSKYQGQSRFRRQQWERKKINCCINTRKILLSRPYIIRSVVSIANDILSKNVRKWSFPILFIY